MKIKRQVHKNYFKKCLPNILHKILRIKNIWHANGYSKIGQRIDNTSEQKVRSILFVDIQQFPFTFIQLRRAYKCWSSLTHCFIVEIGM